MKTRIVAAMLVALGGTLGALDTRRAPAATAAAAPLYQADWAAGLDDWNVYRGFSASQGRLTFDGAGDNGAFAPFMLHGLKDFAVEADIQLGISTKPKQAAFDLFVRRSIVQQRSGLLAGYDAFAGESTATKVADLYWSADRAYYVPGAALDPTPGFHMYRLEVRANDYRFLMDGQVMVPWTAVTLPNAFDLVGLSFTYISAVVKSFAVVALPAVPAGSALDPTTIPSTSALLARTLSPRYVMQPSTGVVFRDNARYAIDSKVSLVSVRHSDRLYGVVQTFEDNETYVQESLNIHKSAGGAKVLFDLFSTRLRSDASTQATYHVIDTAAMGIGDESFAFAYQYQYQGSPSYRVTVVFHRGDYYVAIVVDSANKVVSQTAVTLAQQADMLVRG
ncbi:MAG TPA: hypothetical protein VNL71_19390 [Chloroflexota bacterium]|nr:hypothetical protein [Chloroflexota bacterium]